MKAFDAPEWAQVFVPDASLVESFLRGSAVYLSLLALFRIILKRQGGAIGLPDVMLVVLVSECVSPALSAEAKSVPNGLAAVAALLFWNFALDWAAARSAWLRRRLEPEPVQLVRDGQPVKENLAAEGITEDELAAQLRQSGIDDAAKVKAAYIESGGAVSVIPKEKDEDAPPPADAPAPAPRPASATEFAAAVRRFLDAAGEVRAAVAWHEGRAEDHRAAAKAARKLLTRHGVRAGKAAPPQPDDDPSLPLPEPRR